MVQSKDKAGEWNMIVRVSLTGLTPSTSYSIQVAAVNEEGDVGLYSVPVTKQTSKFSATFDALSMVYSYFTLIYTVPVQTSVTVGTTTATSISLSWTSAGSEVDSYEVMWTSDECPDDIDEGSATITETSYIIEGLREGTRYTITVSATSSVGTSPSDSVTGETQELGT